MFQEISLNQSNATKTFDTTFTASAESDLFKFPDEAAVKAFSADIWQLVLNIPGVGRIAEFFTANPLIFIAAGLIFIFSSSL